MLSNDTINNKPVITKNGELQIDLTARVFNFANIYLSVTNMYIASREMVMRPDLVARMMYGDVAKFDWVCKTNAISNPFSLDAGAQLYQSLGEDVQSAITNPAALQSTADSVNASSFYFDENRLSVKDKNRLDFIKKKAMSMVNGATTVVPPNIAAPGDKEITRKNGKVYFGNDVVGNAQECPDPLSRAKLKAKLIQNRLFGTI
jgi:hypothetical protein